MDICSDNTPALLIESSEGGCSTRIRRQYPNIEIFRDHSFSAWQEYAMFGGAVAAIVVDTFSGNATYQEGESDMENVARMVSSTFFLLGPIMMTMNKMRSTSIIMEFCSKRDENSEEFYILASARTFEKYRYMLSKHYVCSNKVKIPHSSIHKYLLNAI